MVFALINVRPEGGRGKGGTRIGGAFGSNRDFLFNSPTAGHLWIVERVTEIPWKFVTKSLNFTESLHFWFPLRTSPTPPPPPPLAGFTFLLSLRNFFPNGFAI